MEISVEAVYKELMELKKEIFAIRYALIPEEEVGSEELFEIICITKEMEEGERIKLEDALRELNV